jgi:hypothetical protein
MPEDYSAPGYGKGGNVLSRNDQDVCQMRDGIHYQPQIRSPNPTSSGEWKRLEVRRSGTKEGQCVWRRKEYV